MRMLSLAEFSLRPEKMGPVGGPEPADSGSQRLNRIF